MIRRIVSVAVLCQALVCAAQPSPQEQPAPAPPQGSSWAHVQALPVDTSIRVQSGGHHTDCRIKRVDPETLACVRHRGDANETVFQRSDVTSIKLPHRGRSTLIGAAIGIGAGAAVGFAAGTNNNNDAFFGKNFLRGAVAAFGGAVGGAAGAPLGYFSDFSKSTVYKAP